MPLDLGKHHTTTSQDQLSAHLDGWRQTPGLDRGLRAPNRGTQMPAFRRLLGMISVGGPQFLRDVGGDQLHQTKFGWFPTTGGRLVSVHSNDGPRRVDACFDYTDERATIPDW